MSKKTHRTNNELKHAPSGLSEVGIKYLWLQLLIYSSSWPKPAHPNSNANLNSDPVPTTPSQRVSGRFDDEFCEQCQVRILDSELAKTPRQKMVDYQAGGWHAGILGAEHTPRLSRVLPENTKPPRVMLSECL